jgi:hypothetical protein
MMPPTVAAAAMKPNNLLPCSLVKRSTMNAQNTDTTKRLKTEVQMKKARPTHTFAPPDMVLNSIRKTSRFRMKNR